ncbi:hypothetical protein D7D52_18445 [Nocardia yunnanensis]|uniref:Uncharacterized protein n=1 Tax=Nocardia yunnanensis TaxID=2382165 RepID=A0A386ZEG2_9NOCA|nr:hypothetical protein D7D52_18445 [Nocardia yunnanensis]
MPADVLEASNLKPQQNPDNTDQGAVKTNGCDYWSLTEKSQGDSKYLIVEVTNMTTEYYRYFHGGKSVQQTTIGGRAAVVDGPLSERVGQGCTVLVDIKGGGLRFDVASSVQDPCTYLVDFAGKVVPILPAAA